MLAQKARRMLALMDRAVTLWHLPVIGRAKGRVIRRLLERHECERALEIGSLLATPPSSSPARCRRAAG